MSSNAKPSAGRRFLRRLAIALLVVAGLLAVDVLRAPERQLSARVLLRGIDVYQATWSRFLAKRGAQCRFHPTCSHYAEGAIQRHGALVGGAKAIHRIARCGPWTPLGTDDPP